MIVKLIEQVYSFCGEILLQIPLPGGGSVGISLLIILLIPAGIYFTIHQEYFRSGYFLDMVTVLTGKKEDKNSLSTFQTLIVSTATRVGMGNLVGVVAAVSAGGAGAIFWMWVTALIGSSTAFIEATLAQIHKEKRSFIRRFPRRTGRIHDYGRQDRKEEKSAYCLQYYLPSQV